MRSELGTTKTALESNRVETEERVEASQQEAVKARNELQAVRTEQETARNN